MQALSWEGKVNKSNTKLVRKFICIKVILKKPFKYSTTVRASNSSEDRLWTGSNWNGLIPQLVRAEKELQKVTWPREEWGWGLGCLQSSFFIPLSLRPILDHRATSLAMYNHSNQSWYNAFMWLSVLSTEEWFYLVSIMFKLSITYVFVFPEIWNKYLVLVYL